MFTPSLFMNRYWMLDTGFLLFLSISLDPLNPYDPTNSFGDDPLIIIYRIQYKIYCPKRHKFYN